MNNTGIVKKAKNQRLMIFSKEIDSVLKDEVFTSHKFCIDFSKKYISNKKILNVGSWTGQYEALAINYAQKITSVDIEEKALAVLRKNFPKIECRKAYSHKLPFSNNSFDVVTLWAVIEHIPVGYELASLMELRRVLKPKGYLFLNTMNKSFLSDILDPAYWLVGHRHYSKIQLESMLADAGFVIEKTLIHSSFLTAFDAISFYIFKHIFRIKKPQVKFIQRMIDKDYYSKGFYEITIRARVK